MSDNPTSKQRLLDIQRRLEERGVTDVKFFWGNTSEKPLSQVASDVADVLEAYLNSETNPLPPFGDSMRPDETTENPNNAPAKDLLIVSTGPWNENRFTVCRGTIEVEDDIIADFVHRADAELFVAAKRGAEEPTTIHLNRSDIKCVR